MSFDRAEFIALIISIASESLFVICCSQLFQLDWRKAAIAATTGTLITHPILWQLFIALSPSFDFVTRSISLEFLVAIFEGLIYRLVTSCRWRNCMLLSFGANFCSYTIGMLLSRLQQ